MSKKKQMWLFYRGKKVPLGKKQRNHIWEDQFCIDARRDCGRSVRLVIRPDMTFEIVSTSDKAIARVVDIMRKHGIRVFGVDCPRDMN